MKNILDTRLIIASFLFLPVVASAQAVGDVAGGISTIGGLINTLTRSVGGALATLALTIAVLAFFWGIIEYIWGKRTGEAKKIKLGGAFMFWGVLALFVMFSVWGIVRYAQRIFGIEGQTTIQIPDIRFGGSGGTTGATGATGATGNTSLGGAGDPCNSSGACQAGLVCTPNNGVDFSTGGVCRTGDTPLGPF